MFALQGRGARAAHQPLELWILVRIQAPLPNSREGGAYFVKQASLLASRGEPVLLPDPLFLVRAEPTRSVCAGGRHLYRTPRHLHPGQV